MPKLLDYASTRRMRIQIDSVVDATPDRSTDGLQYQKAASEGAAILSVRLSTKRA